MASITACNVAPVMVKASVAKTNSAAVTAAPMKSFTGLKAATLFTKTEKNALSVSNGSKTNAMMVWTPVNNKFFETFSYLPPLSSNDIAKQIQYMTRNGYTPCIEFAEPDKAYTSDHGTSGIDSRTFAGYYDNRYWAMWKLPMFGCTDGQQVLAEIGNCARAFPNSYIRVCGFDNVKQVQTVSFLVHRPDGATEFQSPSTRSV